MLILSRQHISVRKGRGVVDYRNAQCQMLLVPTGSRCVGLASVRVSHPAAEAMLVPEHVFAGEDLGFGV